MFIRKILNRVGQHVEKTRGVRLKPGRHEQDDYSNAAIADILKVSPAVANNWKNRGTIPYEELINFCVEYRCSIHWLLTGKRLQAEVETELNTIDGELRMKELIQDLRYFREKTKHLEKEVALLKKSSEVAQ